MNQIFFKDHGSRLANYLVIGGASIGVLLHQTMNGPMMWAIKDSTQMFKDGYPVVLTPGNQAICKAAVAEARIARIKKPDIKFFQCSGDEPIALGSINMSHGTEIGLPWNFTYTDVKEIDRNEIRVFGDQTINWDGKSGKKLLESLVLSDEAKKFVVLKEIYRGDNYHVYWNTTWFLFSIMLGKLLLVSLSINEKFNSKSLMMQRVTRTAVILVTIAQFIMGRDILHQYYDNKSDQKAVSHGDSYYKGSMEYYGKLIDRHKVYRRLLGNDGPTYFTADGDVIRPFYHRLIFPSNIPVTAKVNNINDFLNYHHEEEKL